MNIEGCLDETACNYTPQANMADGSCEYAELGYDCEGTFTEYVVGMEAEGGFVFYVDESGQHGLVAVLEDLDGQFEWGCYEEGLFSTSDIAIGAGYQNTMNILDYGCETVSGDITATEAAFGYEVGVYNDWYLPSQEELKKMYYTIGQESTTDNLAGFESGWYWSSTSIYEPFNSTESAIGILLSSDYQEYGLFLFNEFHNPAMNMRYYNRSVRPIRSF